MNRSHILSVLALVGSAGLTACGSTPVAVVAPPPPPPPPVAVIVPPPPAPPAPRLTSVCDAEIRPGGHLHFPHEVEFEIGKSQLKSSDTTNRILQCLVDFLAQNKMVTRFRLEGHTDNQGDPNANVVLSEARAKAVVDWMIAHGADAKMLSYKGFGEKGTVAPNDSPEHMAMNRRVEFHIDEINGVKATKELVHLAMNPPAPAATTVAVTSAPVVGVAVPGVAVGVPAVGVAVPGVAVAAPGVAVTAPGVAVAAPGVTVGVGLGAPGAAAPPKKK